MKTPQVLPLVKSFVARLFSLRSSQLENTTYLSPPNHPPALVVEVMVVGSTPIQAGGYTDTWGATLNGRDIILESYRFYEIGGDIECTSRVRNDHFFTHCRVHMCSRDTTQRFRHTLNSLIRTLSHLLVLPP